MTGHSLRGDRGLEKVVERQMRNWELARTQRLAVPGQEHADVEDFVAISRQVGAGGAEVASQLGDVLGWPVFDKEILGVMAGDDAIRERIYRSMDERDVSWSEETLRSIVQPEFIKNDYFHRLTQTVLSIARQGHAVFLGRGIDLILPKRRGLRVRLTAPREQRVEVYSSERGVSPEQARAELARIDKDRMEFIRKHFTADPDDVDRWDLSISLERLTVVDAVGLILSSRERLAGRA